MSKILFIGGTDTNIGKSIVTGLLGRFLLCQGYSVVTQKWVQTGVDENSPDDIDTHLRLMGKDRKEYRQYLPLMLPYSFPLPASPHLAARSAKRIIASNRLTKSTKSLASHFDYVLVEGTGGLLVPLNSQTLLIDVVKKMSLPVILAAGNKVGAINHTLLSIEALQKRNMQILGVVWNTISKTTDPRIVKDNPLCVENISGIRNLGMLPYEKNPANLQKHFSGIGAKMLHALANI